MSKTKKVRTEAEAMRLVLEAISHKVARIERWNNLEEFCFKGMRYCTNGNWRSLVNLIGADVIDAAITKATKP